jgi:hypothetical protein
MKRITFIFLLFISFSVNLSAIENHPVGARSLALSHAFITLSDTWSTFHNQASITNINNFSAGIFYESKFMVDELSLTAGSFVLPVSAGTFGFSFYQFGKGDFKENKVGVAFAKQLSEKFSAAIQLDYFSQRMPENSCAFGFVTFETGIIYSPNKKMFLGAHISNPILNGIETNEGKQKSPTVFRFGGHYQFAKMILVTAEFQKDLENPFILKTGIEFSPAQNFSLRFGISGKPVSYTAGIGYTFGKITTDIGFSYHGNLGVTPSVSVQIRL